MGFPRQVRRDIGQALYAAQQGETDPSAKPLKGFGGGAVLEIVADHSGNTWRGVYTVRYSEAIYVLHAFQKKSKRGIATPKRDLDLIHQRLAEAERLHRQGRIDMAAKKKSPMRAEKSSGNVFADLGLPHSEQELLKAKLTLQIYRLIKGRDLTQAEAGKILGIKQPHVSLLMRNRSGSFSVERLMDFLTAMGQDIEISVRPARKDKHHGEVSVVA